MGDESKIVRTRSQKFWINLIPTVDVITCGPITFIDFDFDLDYLDNYHIFMMSLVDPLLEERNLNFKMPF